MKQFKMSDRDRYRERESEQVETRSHIALQSTLEGGAWLSPLSSFFPPERGSSDPSSIQLQPQFLLQLQFQFQLQKFFWRKKEKLKPKQCKNDDVMNMNERETALPLAPSPSPCLALPFLPGFQFLALCAAHVFYHR